MHTSRQKHNGIFMIIVIAGTCVIYLECEGKTNKKPRRER